MNQTGFASLACALIFPLVAGCDPSGLEPIGTGSSTASTASTGSGGTGGEAGSTSASATTSGTGGAAQGDCAPACGSGEVCIEASCHALVTLDSTTQANGCTIVLDADTAYWSTSEVRIVPKAGGQPTTFKAWVTQPSGLAVDDAYLYFNAGNGGIARAKKNGKSGFGPFAGEGYGSPKHIVSDGSMLYYIEGPTDSSSPAVYQSPTTGAPMDPTLAPTVFATNIYGVGNLAVDATSLYYWGGSGLLKEHKTTHAQTDLGPSGVDFNTDVDGASGIVVDGATVYYSTLPIPGEGGVVARVSGAGGASTVVVDGKTGFNGVFTVDASDVYFMTVSGVMKVARSGGAPVLVSALNPPSPFATCMASDDKYVYWVDGLNLMQLAK
jgi:hypothetical protein